MTKFIGRQFDIGIGKESTRATPVVASFWMPDVSLTIDDKVRVTKNESSVGVIEDGVGQDMTGRFSEATLEGRVTDVCFGLILSTLMGTEAKSTVSGESVVYDHKFTVLQTAQHPSVSLSVFEPNASTGMVFPLGMLDSLDLTLELDKYAMYKAVYKANTHAAQANTVAYTNENPFRPQDATFGVAPTLPGANGTLTGTGTCATTIHVTGLSINTSLLQVGMTVVGTNIPVGATIATIVSGTAFDLSAASTGTASSYTFGPATIALKKVQLQFKKNTEDDQVLGNLDPIDRLNKAFAVSGSFELYYTDRTWIDTVMLGDLYKALQFKLINTTVGLGSTSFPTLTINLARTKLQEVSRKVDLKGIVSQTIKFTAFYSLSDTEMLDITLRNLQSTTY